MHPRAKGTRHTQHQHGGAMLVMLVVLVIGVVTVFAASLSSTAIANRRNQTTAEALARAKEALIGYAVTYGDTHAGHTYGYLPCPDVDETGVTQEGIEHGNCGATDVNTIGRFPWKSLDLPALFDGYGECLWYAVSGNYKSNPKTGAPFNWDKTSLLHVYGSDGNEIGAGEIVAVVIAPGSPVSGNSDRAGTAAPTCGGNYTAAAYLDNDTTHGKNNADGATGSFILPHEHRDANGNVTLTVNDQLIYITRQDIWYAIENRIAREAKQCLDSYAASNNSKYPWAVPVSTSTVFAPLFMGSHNTRFGRLPTRPNVQTESTPSMIVDMQSKFAELWAALAIFEAGKTSANLAAMKIKAAAAENAADDVKDYYDGDPLEDPARNLREAADAARDLTTLSSGSSIDNIQQDIIDAANGFVDAMPNEFSQATGMTDTWPASCTLFSSARWDHWRDLVFYQLASGYQPGSSAACDVGGVNSCLSLNISDQAQTGSGTYRASVVIAGKKLGGGARAPATVGDYLEAVNQSPMADNTQPYNTYRMTDSSYQAINDRVLCVDAGVNCN